MAAAKEHKAFDLVLLEVGELTSLADYFFICSGRSTRQVQSVAENIKVAAKKRGGLTPLGMEGERQGRWVLLDFGEIIVHIFYHELREFYDLEGLWMEAPRIDIGPEDHPADDYLEV